MNLTGLPFIDDIYNRLGQESWFKERPGQRELSKDIFRTLTTPGATYAAEAPTGTGKTLGYLIGGLAAARMTKKPLVVATATVVLQRQVMTQDVDTLVKVGVLRQSQVTLLKGRGRYYCPFLAESVARVTPQASLFDVEEDTYRGQDLVQDMHIEFLAGRWSGDQDDWSGELPQMWSEVACNSRTCIGSSCAFAPKCKYLKSRADAAFSEVVVANHDMVLTDLMLRQDGASVMPIDDYLLVFDEGHHLPDKAKARAECELTFETGAWLAELGRWREDVGRVPGIADAVLEKSSNGAALDDALDEVKLEDLLTRAQEALGRYLPLNQTDCRFPGGLPAAYQSQLHRLHIRSASGYEAVKTANTVLADGVKHHQDAGDTAEVKRLRTYLSRGLGFEGRLRDLHHALDTLYLGANPVVWAFEGEHGLGIKSSPMDGAEVLEEILWPAAIPVAIVSATLRAMGKFDRFATRTGLPAHTVTRVFSPVLPYHNSDLVLCDPGRSPTDPDFEDAVVAALEELVDESEGTLVLFTSNTLLRRVRNRLSPGLSSIALTQFSQANSVLVQTHKRRIDQGHGSLLLGVDSFSEGLDLPGHYCTHVIIVRLPFSRPNDPVEQARKDADPEGYFENNALPDASVKLVQSAGRLVRRETDTGKISLLDNRLLYRRYGQLLLANLPSFKRARRKVGLALTN